VPEAFRVAAVDGRPRLIDPDGRRFVSIGVAHADPTNLQYPHNFGIWRERYGSVERWIADGLVADLRAWNMNTIGATEEYVSGRGLATSGATVDIGHSPGWPPRDYLRAEMPYLVPLRPLEIETWNGHPYYRDVFSAAFDEWCDYLARSICLPQVGSRALVGYVLTDGPGWARHPSGAGFGAADDTELERIADRYFATVTAAIRRHDPDHLILGDRFGMVAGMPEPVLRAAARHGDAICVQTFPPPDRPEAIDGVVERLDEVHALTGLPILIVDIGNWTATPMNPDRASAIPDQAGRAVLYEQWTRRLIGQPWCLGWHWCSYVENPARGYGLKDPYDEPYRALTDPITRVNAEILAEQGHGEPA
jgi:hypothetical protein